METNSSVAFLEDVEMNTSPQAEKAFFKSRMEKVLCGVVSVLVFVVIVVLCSMVGKASKDNIPTVAPTPIDGTLCTDEWCVRAAANFLDNINLDVDPCEDFWEHACGGWTDFNVIPDDKARYGTFDQLREQNRITLRKILEEENTDDTYAKAFTFYNSCLDMDNIDAQGTTPINHLWNMMDFRTTSTADDIWTVNDWTQVSNKIALLTALSFDTDPIFSVGVGIDDKDSTQNAIFMAHEGLTLPSKEYYVALDVDTDENLLVLQDVISRIFQLVEPSSSTSAIATRARNIVLFEQVIADNTVDNDVLRDPQKNYNPKSIDDLTQESASFDWDMYFQTAFAGKTIDTVIVATVDFINDLHGIIGGQLKQTIVDYLRWRVVEEYHKFLNQDVIDIYFDLSKQIYGTEVQTARWDTCVSYTDDHLGFMIGELFVQETFQGSSQITILEMIQEIVNEFKLNLDTLEWMDETTKVKAKEKADAVTKKIGFPEFIQTPARLVEYYDGFLVNDDWFLNHYNWGQWDWQTEIDKLDAPVDHSEWHMTPATVNAYYSPSGNEIVFPAGILQPYFFHQEFIDAVNFGAIGAVIGHELTHGFDDQGAQYDKDGNLETWWTDSSFSNFEKQVDCMIAQYSNYTMETSEGTEHVNGNLTIGENIADNGGIKAAFAALATRLAANSKNRGKLPGFDGDNPDYTDEQMFFYGFASVWCYDIRPEEAHRLLSVDPHSPHKYRVIGTVSNSQYFADTFHCPVKAPMNPEKKCQVW